MKIKLLHALAGRDINLSINQVVTTDKLSVKEMKRLVEAGLAEPYVEEKAPRKKPAERATKKTPAKEKTGG